MLAVVMLGDVFSTVTLVEEDTEEPSESVVEAVQVIVEPTSVSEAFTT